MDTKKIIRKRKISILHPYIENRLAEFKKDLYPKNHFWGLDQFEKNPYWDLKFIKTEKTVCPKPIERFFNKIFFKNSPGIKAEISAWKESRKTDIIYSIGGPLALGQFYRKAKIVAWVFQKPNNSVKSILNPYSRRNLKSNSVLLCLTPRAEKYFSSYTKSTFIPWCVDLDLFDGKQSTHKPGADFFLATGKTGRDYDTLLNAAHSVNAEIRIIGPRKQRPNQIPSNVIWIETSDDPPDKAIDYDTLRDWYSHSKAVCIPLSGDADDTCGYTNMLEAMAMKKPVLMTRSGALHINPETGGFGMHLKPKDTEGWSEAMNSLLKNHNKASVMGKKGRKIVENDFTIERFNQNVIGSINNILKEV
jgi:glycosyltransferase involved in cell wall biosynthesis